MPETPKIEENPVLDAVCEHRCLVFIESEAVSSKGSFRQIAFNPEQYKRFQRFIEDMFPPCGEPGCIMCLNVATRKRPDGTEYDIMLPSKVFQDLQSINI